MKKIVYTSLILFAALFFVQCSEDDNNNVIDPDATCSDGIQNGDEDGIDCGGSVCEPCDDEPTGLDFSGTYVQEDQVGRPAISRVYITPGLSDDFNTTIPSEMTSVFQENIQTNLEILNPDFDSNGGNGLGTNQDAVEFTTMLSRDVLWVAQNGATTFYDGNTILTGRRLQDDVMDFHLRLLFGGPDLENPINDGSGDDPLLISDGVDSNDKDFLAGFPYLAPPF
mgnify:CR=1 FL=1